MNSDERRAQRRAVENLVHAAGYGIRRELDDRANWCSAVAPTNQPRCVKPVEARLSSVKGQAHELLDDIRWFRAGLGEVLKPACVGQGDQRGHIKFDGCPIEAQLIELAHILYDAKLALADIKDRLQV